MRQIVMAAAAALVLGNALPHASAADEAKKNDEVTGQRIKSDIKGFGHGMKQSGVETGRTIAKGSKQAGTSIADGVKDLAHGKTRARGNKKRPTEQPAGGRAGGG